MNYSQIASWITGSHTALKPTKNKVRTLDIKDEDYLYIQTSCETMIRIRRDQIEKKIYDKELLTAFKNQENNNSEEFSSVLQEKNHQRGTKKEPTIDSRRKESKEIKEKIKELQIMYKKDVKLLWDSYKKEKDHKKPSKENLKDITGKRTKLLSNSEENKENWTKEKEQSKKVYVLKDQDSILKELKTPVSKEEIQIDKKMTYLKRNEEYIKYLGLKNPTIKKLVEVKQNIREQVIFSKEEIQRNIEMSYIKNNEDFVKYLGLENPSKIKLLKAMQDLQKQVTFPKEEIKKLIEKETTNKSNNSKANEETNILKLKEVINLLLEYNNNNFKIASLREKKKLEYYKKYVMEIASNTIIRELYNLDEYSDEEISRLLKNNSILEEKLDSFNYYDNGIKNYFDF